MSDYLAGVPHLDDLVKPGDKEPERAQKLLEIKRLILQRRKAYENENNTLVPIEPPYGFYESRRG
ncbi:MAG TPA: hypothetical protein VD906_07035 [Caulobacteraceae bacterium]|nr:hypothetical protein [Caulobacteraceae bacterium]